MLRRCSQSTLALAALGCLLHRSSYATAFTTFAPLACTPRYSTSSKLAAIATSPQDFNEFSRKISTEKILGGRQSRRSNFRDFRVDLEASPEECEALAKRFQLQAVASLQASLALRPAFSGDDDIQVEGSMQASLTQRCVRTNDSFEVSVEFPIDMTIRPARPENSAFPEFEPASNNKHKKRKKQNQRTSSSSRSIEDLDVAELQRLVNSDILRDEDNVMEDEAILTVGGMLDVGELVSQVFWLSLDPYPKKPGSEWTQTSISG